jgi:hypothetical protein
MGFAASEDWTELYPSSDFSKNVGQGLECFLGVLDDETAKDGYYDEASCRHLFHLVVLYSLSVISVGVAVDKIVNGGGELIWNVLGIVNLRENGRNTSSRLFSTLLLRWTNSSYQGYVSRGQCRDNPFGHISIFI